MVKGWSTAEIVPWRLMLCLERRVEKRRPLEPTEFEVNSECSVGSVRLAENVNRESADDELRSSLSLERNMSAVVSSSIVQVRSAELRGNGAQSLDSRPEDGAGDSDGEWLSSRLLRRESCSGLQQPKVLRRQLVRHSFSLVRGNCSPAREKLKGSNRLRWFTDL